MTIKSTFKMVTKKKAGQHTKFGKTSQPKDGIIPLLSVYLKK